MGSRHQGGASSLGPGQTRLGLALLLAQDLEGALLLPAGSHTLICRKLGANPTDWVTRARDRL